MPLATSILVPTDLSPASYSALAEAARIAELAGAKVRLLYVFDVSPFSLPPGVVQSESTLRRMAEEATGAACSVLAALRDRFFHGLHDVEVATLEHEGAAAGICALAAQSAADLIVLATHGRGGHQGSVGGVTEKVVRSAPCRVLVVPSTDVSQHSH